MTKQKFELTRIGKENRPRLEPGIRIGESLESRKTHFNGDIW
jgi:hypothetical protein